MSKGSVNHIGVVKRGRVKERLLEHIRAGKIKGSKVTIKQTPTITDAKHLESILISTLKPKYNKEGK